MRHPLKRHYGQGDLHFVTFSCYRRRPLLGTRRAKDQFVKILNEVRDRHRFRLIGYVVMPEHVHLLISESAGKNPSKVLQVLKQKVAKKLLKKQRRVPEGQMCLPFGGEEQGEEHFWQRRFYDFNVWSEKKLKEKLEYMHANPVQRKLVKHPKDWPWSSWPHYAGRKGRYASTRMENEFDRHRKVKTRTLKTAGCGTLSTLSDQCRPLKPALGYRKTIEKADPRPACSRQAVAGLTRKERGFGMREEHSQEWLCYKCRRRSQFFIANSEFAALLRRGRCET